MQVKVRIGFSRFSGIYNAEQNKHTQQIEVCENNDLIKIGI